MSIDLKAYIAEQIAARPIEAGIIARIYETLEAAGDPVVRVFDGEENTPVKSLDDLNTAVFNLDEAYIYTKSGGYVFAVMGEEWDLIADHSLDLDDLEGNGPLVPVNEWIAQNW